MGKTAYKLGIAFDGITATAGQGRCRTLFIAVSAGLLSSSGDTLSTYLASKTHQARLPDADGITVAALLQCATELLLVRRTRRLCCADVFAVRVKASTEGLRVRVCF